MTYQVLARKWRPRTFSEMVGQEHVVRVLANALDQDRVHHAFLFSGTRGVGKTTVARILAKALNCEEGVSSKPCLQCAACLEIEQGRFVDLLEVDAASRTGVDDTRELLDNVQYTPVRGRYKVYLIDEVHMFSKSSFNALLKTLEEPPPHVKFLLATTDPRKLPVTVLSRCLQFNLRTLPVALIADHLEKILASEEVSNETGAVRQLARAAQGSMRDALSLLDQAIAFGGGGLSTEDVTNMLGAIDQAHVLALLNALADGDAKRLLQTVADMDTLAPDYAQVLAELLHDLQRLAVLQMVPEAATEDDQELVTLSERLSPEDVQLYYQIALIGRRDLPLAPDPRTGLEMLLLRMITFCPDNGEPQRGTKASKGPAASTDTPELAATSAAPSPDAKPVVQRMRPSGLARQALSSAMAVAAPESVEPMATETGGAPERVPDTELGSPRPALKEVPSVPPGEQNLYDADSWAELLPSLALEGMAAQLASHCVLESVNAESVHVTLEETQAHLRSPAAEQRFVDALTKCFGGGLRVRFRTAALGDQTPAARRDEARAVLQREAEEAIASDPNIKLLQEQFEATIRPGSISPLDG